MIIKTKDTVFILPFLLSKKIGFTLIMVLIGLTTSTYNYAETNEKISVMYIGKNTQIEAPEWYEERFYELLHKKKIRSYYRPIAIIKDGKYLNPYENMGMKLKVIKWAKENNFTVIDLPTDKHKSCLIDFNDYVFVPNYGQAVYRSGIPNEPEESKISTNNYIAYANKKTRAIFVDKKRIKINKFNLKADEEVITRLYNEKNLRSERYETRMSIYSTAHGYICGYMKYIRNEKNKILSRSGIFSYQENEYTEIFREGYGGSKIFDYSYLGDIDLDTNDEFVLEKQTFSGKSAYSNFDIYEYNNGDWEKIYSSGPFSCATRTY